MALSIPTRLLAVSTALMLLWWGAGTYVLARNELDAMGRELTETLDSQVELLVPGLTEQVVVGNYDMIERMLAVRAKTPPIASITWHDAAGTQLRAIGIPQRAHTPEWFVAWARLPELEKSRPIAVGGASYGHVTVSLDPAGALDQLWQTLEQSALLLLAGIGALLLAILVVIRTSLRPLKALKLAAQRFGSGDYSQRVSPTGPPEMAAAANAFNRMAESLENALDSLRESEARWQFALEGAGDGVWDWDVRTDRVFYSTRWKAMLGHVDAEVGDSLKEWQSRIHPDDLPGAMEALFRHLHGDAEVYTNEHRLRCKDGSYRWFLDRGKAVQRDEKGTAMHVIGTHTDITARREAEAELRHHRDQLQDLVYEQTADLRRAKDAAEAANRGKSIFLANMSHELRTPMHAVQAFAQIGKERSSDERIKGYFARIHDSGERLLALINDLLDLSRLEAGRMNYDTGEVNLHDTVMEVASEVRPLLGAKRLELSVAPPVRPPLVAGDAARLAQVVRNVVANAIRFSPDGGLIEVAFDAAETGETSGQLVEMTIADQGVGIPEHELEVIFDKFVQSSKTRSNAGGTGLGLAICREIVCAHNGRIHARNGPAGGAVFHIELPAHTADSVCELNSVG